MMIKKGTKCPVTKINELKRAIVASPDATDYCKKALLWLIDHSKRFSISVGLESPNDEPGKEIAFGACKMNSDNCQTQLGKKLSEMMGGSISSGTDTIAWGHCYLLITRFGQGTHNFTEAKKLRYTPKAINRVNLDLYR